jgi:hypothetical protein
MLTSSMANLNHVVYADVIRYVAKASPVAKHAVPAPTNICLLQQRLRLPGPVPLYHVGLLGEDVHTGERRLFEHGPEDWVGNRFAIQDDVVCTPLPPVYRALDDISEYANTLPQAYILGIRDCRHHVADILKWCYHHHHG